MNDCYVDGWAVEQGLMARLETVLEMLAKAPPAAWGAVYWRGELWAAERTYYALMDRRWRW